MNSQVWAFRLLLAILVAAVSRAGAAADGQLPRTRFTLIVQSSDASPATAAAFALDGNNATCSLTANSPGSFWTAALGRPYLLQRLELVNRAAPADRGMDGLTLRLLDMDDQVVFQAGLTNPGSAGTNVFTWPAGLRARSVWVGLLGSQTNGAGNWQVGLAEARLFGQLTIPYGPDPWSASSNSVRVYQSSDYSSSYPAANAIDGNTATFSHTLNYPNSYWMADLGAAAQLDRVELVNRIDCCHARMGGLVLRIFDGDSNSVASATLPDPGPGGTWSYTPAAGTMGRYFRVGGENGNMNNDRNYYVTLAEARVFSGATNLLMTTSLPAPITNLASGKTSYMVRLTPSLPPATNANDNDLSTDTRTTTLTVDAYWEVDLGGTFALYGVRTIAASGIGYRMTNTFCRLFDGGHNSVFAQKLTGGPDVYDTDLNGPVFARFVRIGLEDKQRTDPSGGLEWYIGMREVEVFGQPTNNVGIASFSTSNSQVSPGDPLTLSWTVDDVRRLEIHPAFGSVGTHTAASGAGTVTFTATNSQEYLLVASNTAGLFTRAVSMTVGASNLPIRFSEIVAANQYSLKDGFGNSPDWIELRNPANETVNLAGCGLSDDPAQPMKGVFPAVSIPGHGTLVVFASGAGAPFDPAGNLHANFHLSRTGGTLVLTAADGTTTLDRLPACPEMDTDLAYGRDLEGHWCFMEPTPGAPNTAPTYAGWLRPLTFSQERGFCSAPFTLTLSNENAGASVLYSLDGSIPSLPYTRGLTISRTSAVRAQVTRPGYKPARIQTYTYIFVNDVIASPLMQTSITQNAAYAARLRPGLRALPSISLVLPGTPNYDEHEGSLEVLWPDGSPPAQANCGIYVFGGSWESFAKNSFTAKFRAAYGTSKLRAPLFDGFDRGVAAADSFDRLDFRAGDQDMSERGFYMSNRFVEDTMLDMGSLNPHGRFVHIYLNGVYWGQYDAKEVLMEHFLADYLGGAPENYVSVKGNDNVGDDFVVGTPDPPNVQPWARVLALAGSYNQVRPYLDVRHLCDFMLMWNYGDCESEFRACGPLDRGSGFKFWEADADGFLRTSALGENRTANTGPGGLFGALVAENNSDFKTLLADRIYAHCFNNGALTPGQCNARLVARMTEINNSLLAECARWGYQTPASWAAAEATIRSSLFPARTAQLVSYLRSAGLYPAFDPPACTPFGGLVTNGLSPRILSSAGTIYYTLDGTDPRLPGGAISPSALIWTNGALTITGDLALNLRVRTTGGAWSALAQPRYLLAPRGAPTPHDLLVTEIHYHPAGSDDCEFVELYNAGTNLLDLSGVFLTNAVRFTFPAGYALNPGAFAVVTKSTNAFAALYQAPASPWYWPGIAVAGQWSGSLDNAGETLSLVGADAVELSAISYKPDGLWPTRADGQGSSLELSALPTASASDPQVRAFLADARNWKASSAYQGSPGRFDSFVPAVRINEILTHPDAGSGWLELANTDSRPADLSGCALTDNMGLPARWTFPAHTLVPPSQFLVVSAADWGFDLSALGESLFLLEMAGTNVIRFLGSSDFPAAERGETIGVFPCSDGRMDFTELRAPTPGAPNALPRIGPVVISEIMAVPAAGKAQYLALTSVTNGAVPFFDPSRPANVWTLQGVGAFAFPPGTVLPACSTLLVCSTNPDVFRAQYTVSPSLPVFGPWPGVLAPDGAPLELLRPGEPDPSATVPYYRVDHVTFGPSAPWPAATAGVSLERIPLEAYGNDPAFWTTGPNDGTPGVPSTNRLPVIRVTANPAVAQQMPLTLIFSVADPDAPWQTVALLPAQLPDGSSFDSASGQLTWTPSAAQGPGDFPARFIATDTAACGPNQSSLDLVIHVTQPLLIAAQYVEGALQLSFPVLPGETYRVEYCDNLASRDWLLLEETVAGQTNVATVFDPRPAGSSGRFYRIRQ